MRYLRRGQQKLRIEIPNWTNFEEKWFFCKFCSGDSRSHPEHNIVESEYGRMCRWHYQWYMKSKLKDDYDLDLDESDDEPGSTTLR